MIDEVILDTGPLVALLDADQSAHARCAEWFRSFRGELLTTDAVLTEACHLLSETRGGIATCLRFVLRGGAIVVHGGRARMERVAGLVERYADVPMDYADATLVALAEEMQTSKIFTLDRRGFESYRWARRHAFDIYPRN